MYVWNNIIWDAKNLETRIEKFWECKIKKKNAKKYYVVYLLVKKKNRKKQQK